jgi:hypothetical protein
VVMTAVIDFATAQPQVDADNLAHISLSLGGFLAPRAACFEHRLKAMVPNPGVVSWYRVYESELELLASAFGFGDEIFDLLESDPETFDEEVYAMMNTSDFLHWGFVDSMWHHGVDSPHALMNEIKKFDIQDMIGNISTATLVVDADAETRAQAMELYEGLTGAVQKDYLKFTTEEAAQFHDQPGKTKLDMVFFLLSRSKTSLTSSLLLLHSTAGATGIQSARIFAWLEDVLGTPKSDDLENVESVAATTSNLLGWTALGLVLGVAVEL